MLDDLPVGPDTEAGCTGTDGLDPLALQAHRPLHEHLTRHCAPRRRARGRS